MASRPEIVVTLDGQVVEPRRPLIHADDPTFLRGDGVFETMLLRGGRACLLEAHLTRLERSAAITGLPAPELDRWRWAVDIAAAHWTARWPGRGDAVMRLVFGRGRGGPPTAFVTVSALPDRVLATRRHGVSAMTLDRGVPARSEAATPWSIAAAKSLSYGLNAAALREADRLGFGDVVLVGDDGYVLEGPRSNVVIADARGVLTTPPTTLPILDGTTVRAVFGAAAARGLECRYRPLQVAELLTAQGVWLLSSVTLAARVHTLDGTPLPAEASVVDLSALVDEAIEIRA